MYGCFSHKLTALITSRCNIIIVILTVRQLMLATPQVQLSKMMNISLNYSVQYISAIL